MYRPHIAKERSYSCLLQLSNIMPLRTLSVQYPLSQIRPMCPNVQQAQHTSENWCITPGTKHQQLY